MNASFSEKLIYWYGNNKRKLPWRNTKDPYTIWISEVILQQTRVAQGLSYYYKFTETFPTVYDLANADQQEVLRVWQGLGYYSRARNMHKAAKQVVESHSGKFPSTYQELLSLTGVGTYTAAAIASFAFGEAVPVIDGNVFRVLSRVFGIDRDIAQAKTKSYFFSVASELISTKKPDLFNQAIMEFGALACTPKKPNCSLCPFSSECIAYSTNKIDLFPVKNKKIKTRKRFFNYAVVQHKDKIFLSKRGKKDIWQDLNDFLLTETKDVSSTEDEIITHIATFFNIRTSSVTLHKTSKLYKHVLSHQQIFATFFKVSINSSASSFQDNFFTIKEVEKLPKPVLITNYLNEEFK
ncbi:MAG: A/G-specific adenine glycosylase [Cyclobacteriaceae bacterium]